MFPILIYFFIAISLSMDTFSLALSLGTTNPKSHIKKKLVFLVGLFHFIMPILGSYIGSVFSNIIFIKTNHICALIFIVLIIEMYFQKESDKQYDILNLITIIIIAISVSIDSFSVGLAFGLEKENIFLASTIFSIVSAFFTNIGLNLGQKINRQNEKTATKIGIAILLLVALKYIFLG